MSTTNADPIEECAGYKTLKAAVDRDADVDRKHGRPLFHDYPAKLAWAVARAKHYAEKTGLSAADILNAWEKERTYWYMNFYQDANQPELEGDRIKVFDTIDDAKKSIGKPEFRCPACNGVSKDPYACDSGKKMMVTKGKGKKAKLVESDKVCDWKVYGLFGDLGKGVFVFVKSEMRGQRIFMPIAWERDPRVHVPARDGLCRPDCETCKAAIK